MLGLWFNCMDKDEYDEWVSHVKWRKEVYEIAIGGDTSAHYCQSHRCLELLKEYNRKSYLEELLDQSKNASNWLFHLCDLAGVYSEVFR